MKAEDEQAAGLGVVDTHHVIGTPADVAYEISQKLIRERLREVELVFEKAKKKPAKTVWSIGIQMGVMLAMDAMQSSRLRVDDMK